MIEIRDLTVLLVMIILGMAGVAIVEMICGASYAIGASIVGGPAVMVCLIQTLEWLDRHT